MKFLSLLSAAAVAAAVQFTSASPFKAGKRGDPIPNQYIIVYKKDVDMEVITAHEMWLTSMMVAPAAMSRRRRSLFQHDANDQEFLGTDDEEEDRPVYGTYAYPDFKFLHRYVMNGFKGYTARIPEILAKSLRILPEIDYIEQDTVVTLLETQLNPPSWGLKRIGVPDLPLSKNYTYVDTAGEGVDAYIVDTGVHITHPDFEGRAVIGASFSNDKNDRDGNGHGTHVAGTVGGSKYGVAKKVNIIAVKVLNAQGSGSNSDVIAGIEWVGTTAAKKGNKKAVANMSLGGGASSALDAAVRAAIKNGVMFAVAAGNSAGDACKLSPARVKEALTVAASDKTDKLASFSERGTCVDIIAPGVDITSSWNNGKENTISGTSMASPHACGVLALAAGHREFADPKSLKDYVVAIGGRKKVSGVPKNTPNVLLYADVSMEAPEPSPEDPPEKPEPGEPEDPEEPGDGVCPFPQCLLDPSCTSCCFEGIDC